MPQSIEAQLNASGKKFAIVISRFNEFITSKLLEGAKDCIIRHGCNEDEIQTIWVPGSFEIALIAKMLAETKKYDSIICLGAVIRGSTPHFDYVAGEVSKGIASVSLSTNLPVIYGIITADSIEQAIERAGTKMGNKGWDAALTAIEMANLLDIIKE